MPRFVVAHLLTGDAKNRIDELRSRFDPRTAKAIDAHVTLAGPVNTDAPVPSIEAAVDRTAAQASPFTVRLAGIDSFMPLSQTNFVSVQAGNELTILHERLLAELGWSEQYPYHPHATVTEYLDEAGTREVYERLAGLDIQFQVTVDRLTLLEKADDGSWRPLRHFPLGGEATVS